MNCTGAELGSDIINLPDRSLLVFESSLHERQCLLTTS